MQHRGDIPGLGKNYNPVKRTTLDAQQLDQLMPP